MNKPALNELPAPVKLVIWDLDETFWNGTLSEGGIEAVAAHTEMVRTLVGRGIMCAVCSKNDWETAKSELEKLGIWDMFVFSHIDWTPKGQAIAAMLDRMGLRAENAVFLDDNHLNLEEAQFFNEKLMVVDAEKYSLVSLLDLPQMQGKDDSAHKRLAQYKVMEGKLQEQAATGLSNVDFLRQSGIRIKIITDIENHMDRVYEILNRTNQLNYTKIRANTSKERADFEALLATSGMHAGLVHAQDRYGDYGVVGFFCVRTKFSGTTVHHFAFSCRTLNMGVEQWVWDYLGQPDVDVVNPVANPIKSFDAVDWITEVADFDEAEGQEQKRLCLVGGCDLLQVSFYCGTNRDEFVNKQDDMGMLVRYDDVGFFLNPREMELKHSQPLKNFLGWSLDDMKALDKSLKESDLILLSMYFSVPSDNLFTFGGTAFGGKFWGTVPPRRLKRLMKDPDHAIRFAKQMFHRRLPLEERLELTRLSFAHAYRLKRPEVPLFILGAAMEHGDQAKRTKDMRADFNAMCKGFCEENPGAIFIDVDQLLDPDEFADSDHYTRTGYFKIAQFVNTQFDSVGDAEFVEKKTLGAA